MNQSIKWDLFSKPLSFIVLRQSKTDLPLSSLLSNIIVNLTNSRTLSLGIFLVWCRNERQMIWALLLLVNLEILSNLFLVKEKLYGFNQIRLLFFPLQSSKLNSTMKSLQFFITALNGFIENQNRISERFDWHNIAIYRTKSQTHGKMMRFSGQRYSNLKLSESFFFRSTFV